MELNISGDLTLEDIRKIREYDAKMTEGMTIEEINNYYNKGAEEFRNKLKAEKEKNSVCLFLDIVDFYKSQYGSEYVRAINEDLHKVVKFKKSLKD